LTKHFKEKEFFCPCCKKQEMDIAFVEFLEKARVKAEIPFRITSAYRCEDYQADLKKRGYETASGISPHQKGVAVDIFTPTDKARYLIMAHLAKEGFNRFGVGSNFLHVDIDSERNQNRIWYYKR